MALSLSSFNWFWLYVLRDILHASININLDSLARYMPATGVTLLRKFFLNRGLKYASFAALCTVAGVGWLSLYPTRAYAFRDDLEELRLEYKRFCKALHGLEKQLKIAKEDFIVESQSRGDNV